MNALNLCNNRGSEMWILSCENIWGKYEIWELAGFYTLFVYQIKHIIAPGYAMHCCVCVTCGHLHREDFQEESNKEKNILKKSTVHT